MRVGKDSGAKRLGEDGKERKREGREMDCVGRGNGPMFRPTLQANPVNGSAPLYRLKST